MLQVVKTKLNRSQDCRKSRIKCAFLDDEAEDEDGNPEDDDDNDNFENQFKFAKSASSKDQVKIFFHDRDIPISSNE